MLIVNVVVATEKDGWAIVNEIKIFRRKYIQFKLDTNKDNICHFCSNLGWPVTVTSVLGSIKRLTIEPCWLVMSCINQFMHIANFPGPPPKGCWDTWKPPTQPVLSLSTSTTTIWPIIVDWSALDQRSAYQFKFFTLRHIWTCAKQVISSTSPTRTRSANFLSDNYPPGLPLLSGILLSTGRCWAFSVNLGLHLLGAIRTVDWGTLANLGWLLETAGSCSFTLLHLDRS